MRARSWRVLMPALLAVAALLAGPAGPVLGELPAVTVSAAIGACQLGGSGGADPMTIEHRSSSGALKGTYVASFFGFPSTSWSASCKGKTLLPGDRLRFLDTTVPASPTVIRTYTIPTLTAVTDRIRNRVTGVAKGVPTISVSLQDCLVDTIGCDALDAGAVTAGGPYVYAPAVDATGSTVVTLFRSKGADLLGLTTGFPKLVTRLGTPAVTGIGNPGQTVSVTVRHAGKDSTASRKVSAFRTFKGKIARDGVSQQLAVGDRVRWYLDGKLQGDFTVPAVSMAIGPAHTTGVCFPNSTVVIRGTKPDKTTSITGGGPTGADGSFNVTINIASGWLVTLQCKTTVGDVVQLDGIAGT